ncbi:NlpC/P60 family protein [Mucilaginibacter conchicola]|uniref:NlpC/P60 family protein n=1 Tax=Mucilaginibacter conchicola TaxID=2303333 RepID=A0A372NWW7_9SPHI|nr:C40 family peptidase [Mucilaginibacter conchicola]RFZ94606.1 NlpC/P60 family protein [Mucilaginibacter conchicola]
MRLKYIISLALLISACHNPEPTYVITDAGDTVTAGKRDTLPSALPDSAGVFTKVDVGTLQPAELVAYAQKLKGIPYKYASTDPAEGFDCSGFITYVFNHFGIIVPRRSFDFLHVKHEVDIKHAKPGDLILFTGTDETDRDVGHMGIITLQSPDSTVFIHSTSGHDNKGVVETPLNDYYKKRYVKTVRIFK